MPGKAASAGTGVRLVPSRSPSGSGKRVIVWGKILDNDSPRRLEQCIGSPRRTPTKRGGRLRLPARLPPAMPYRDERSSSHRKCRCEARQAAIAKLPEVPRSRSIAATVASEALTPVTGWADALPSEVRSHVALVIYKLERHRDCSPLSIRLVCWPTPMLADP